MAAAIDVARYLIHLAADTDHSDFLSPLRIQKLLYYAQGWYLAMCQKPLFKEPIEARVDGPVIREVDQNLGSYGKQGVTPVDAGVPQSLTEEEITFLNRFWHRYHVYSTTKLVQMTHEESPWVDAREGLPAEDNSEREISLQSMRDFFRSQLIPGLEPAESWKGLEEIKRGKISSHEEVFAGLG